MKKHEGREITVGGKADFEMWFQRRLVRSFLIFMHRRLKESYFFSQDGHSPFDSTALTFTECTFSSEKVAMSTD